MSFAKLPPEIILMILENLESQRDINAIIRTTTRFALMLDDKLYEKDLKNNRASAVLWAIENNQEGTLSKCIRAGANKYIRAGGIIPLQDRFESHLRNRELPESLDFIPRNPKSHPLITAAANGSIFCVKFLLDCGVEANFLNGFYETPMRQAAGNGHVEIVNLLLARAPSTFSGAFTLRRPIKFAAARGHLPVLKALFDYLRSGDRGLLVGTAAQIILYEGLWHAKHSVAEYALSQGADVNYQGQEAVLQFAPDLRPVDSPYSPPKKLNRGDKREVKIRGTVVRGWWRHSPNTLLAALIGGDQDLVNLVLHHGFDITRLGVLPLKYAVACGNIESARALIRRGVTTASVRGQNTVDPRTFELMCEEEQRMQSQQG